MEHLTFLRRVQPASFLYQIPLLLITGWMIFVLPVFLPNMGGSGLNMPINIIAWLIMACVVAMIWISSCKGIVRGVDANTYIILLSVVILGIPLLYTPPHWLEAGAARWGGVLGGVIFYISLLQYDLSNRKRYGIITSILIAVAFQSIIAICQIWFPESVPAHFAYPLAGTRPYGVFQQVNVLATFVATGLALALMLFMFSELSTARSRKHNLKMCVLGVMIVTFSALLVWLQSRVGWISGVLTTLIMLLLGMKKATRKRVFGVFLLQGMAVVLAVLMQAGGHVDFVDHSASNSARLIIISDTLKMIASKPLLGWGYGGFEYSFQHFRASQGLSTLSLGIVRHPHNEILLWWAEGGLVSLTGLGGILYAGLRITQRSLRALNAQAHKDRYRGCLPLLLLVALLPMLLHTQTEYPFLLSAPLWFVFLLLLAMLQSQLNVSTPPPVLNSKPAWFVGITFIIGSLLAVVFFSAGLYANAHLMYFEQNGLADISAAEDAMQYDLGMNTERWFYDKNLHGLFVFEKTNDVQLLQQYREWAELYLSKRVDRNIYGNLCGVLFLLKDEQSYLRVKNEAQVLFPDDPRFKMDITSD